MTTPKQSDKRIDKIAGLIETLDYDFFGDDYFELYVINDSTIELYHPDSGTTYEFRGRGYIEYFKSGKGYDESKKRSKSSNPTMNVERKKAK